MVSPVEPPLPGTVFHPEQDSCAPFDRLRTNGRCRAGGLPGMVKTCHSEASAEESRCQHQHVPSKQRDPSLSLGVTVIGVKHSHTRRGTALPCPYIVRMAFNTKPYSVISQPKNSHTAFPITNSLSASESQGSSSVNMVTHCFQEQGMRVMSVPQNMRAGPKAS